MKTITDDPVGFIENGGWTFLDPDSDGEGAADDETEDEEDEVYEPTDSEPEGIFFANLFYYFVKDFYMKGFKFHILHRFIQKSESHHKKARVLKISKK
jgi:hypothetical protein